MPLRSLAVRFFCGRCCRAYRLSRLPPLAMIVLIVIHSTTYLGTRLFSAHRKSKDRKRREIYASPNGDHWILSQNALGEYIVVHHPNSASGGRVSSMTLRTFLRVDEHSPQNQALRTFIARLFDPLFYAPRNGA